MADERIGIIVADKVDPNISVKLNAIGNAAKTAHGDIEKLKQKLATLNGNGLNLLAQQMTNIVRISQQLNTVQIQTNQQNVILNQTANQAAIAAAKLAAAQAQASIAQTKLLATQQQLIVAQQAAAQAVIKTAQGMANLTTAQNNAATAAQRLATEQQRTTQAMTQAATAVVQQQMAQTNALTAQQKLAEAQTRAQKATVDLTTAQQRLATEQQRTAVQTQNAAAAADRARLAALQLAEAQNRVGNSAANASTSIMAYAKALALTVGTAMGTEGILKTADAYTVMQNKLRNVAVDQQAVNRLTEEMFELSNKTGQSVTATTGAFQKFDNAMMQMGKGQEETLRLVETLNKATVISGATTMEAASGVLQLGQAFGSGRLQGDEFRSIMENLPVVADMIAKSMGKTRGELKALSSQGKITAEEIRLAFERSASDIDAKYQKMTFTLAQTFEIMNNGFTKWIGELDKSVGFMAMISNGVRWMAKNFDTLGVAASVAGSLLVVAYGPAFITMMTAATRAVMGMSLALATNPIGLLIVGITTATALIATFGDEVKMSADGFVTLKDYGRAALSYIGDGFRETSSFISNAWNTTIDFINSKTDGFGERFRDIFGVIVSAAKANTNRIIAFFVGGNAAILKYWELLPTLMNDVFAQIVNFGASAVETLVNSWQWGLRGIASMASNLAPKMADALTKSLDSVTLELPRMDVSKGVSSMASEIAGEFSKAFQKDYIGDAADAFMKRARDMAVNRVGINTGPGELRGEGVTQQSTAIDEKAVKLAEKRAMVLAKINGELDSQTANLFKLSTVRTIDQQFDNIQIALAQKKIKLTEDEAATIRSKIADLENGKVVQRQYDALYEEALGPMRDYWSAMEAVNRLTSEGAITQVKAEQFVRKLTEARLDATDTLRSFNRETDEQLKLLGFVGPQQEIERAVMQKQNELRAKGESLTTAENNAMREKLALLQQATNVQAVLNDHYATTAGKQTELLAKQQAYNQLLASGKMNGEQYGIAMQKLAVDFSNLKLAMGTAGFEDMITSSLGRITAGYEGVMIGLTNSFGDFFTTFTDGFADSMGKAIVYGDSLSEAMANLSQQIVSGLISALIKLGIQYALNAAMGTTAGATAMAAQTGMSVAAAATTAAAWATPAALVSLASFGGNSVPAMAGITATTALTSGMALAGVAGFEQGGYTGNGGRSDVAGVVHGQEFVSDADATRKYRPVLEAMNNGTYRPGSSTAANVGMGGGANVTVNIINNASGTEIRREETTDENGNMDIVVTIDSIENALAGRMQSGRGALHGATKGAFGLTAKTGR